MIKGEKRVETTVPNSPFAAHFVRPNAFRTSQTRKRLSAIAIEVKQ